MAVDSVGLIFLAMVVLMVVAAVCVTHWQLPVECGDTSDALYYAADSISRSSFKAFVWI